MAEPGERVVLRPDELAGQRADADLGEPGRRTLRGEQLEHRLPVGTRRAEMHADPQIAAKHFAEIRLDGVGARGRVHQDPATEGYLAEPAGQGQRQGPGGQPGGPGSWLAVATHRG